MKALLLAKCRFDAAQGAGAGFGDDAGFVCPACQVGHTRAFDAGEFIVGAPGDPL
jgi:hypothetical protein